MEGSLESLEEVEVVVVVVEVVFRGLEVILKLRGSLGGIGGGRMSLGRSLILMAERREEDLEGIVAAVGSKWLVW